MREHPIIFSKPMVKAIIKGGKTQTRRVTGLEIVNQEPDMWESCTIVEESDGRLFKLAAVFSPKGGHNDGWAEVVFCPYGQAGDRLWVRETWAVDGLWDNTKPSLIDKTASVWYPTSGNERNIPMWVGKMRRSIHMPRWASRITLEITEVRVERLREISETDAYLEGVDKEFEVGIEFIYGAPVQVFYRLGFKHLWDSINGKKYPWSSNPWVWVVSFKKVE